MRVGTKRDAKGSGKTKVCEFQVSGLIKEEISGLQISVEDSVAVTICHRSHHLVHVILDKRGVEGAALCLCAAEEFVEVVINKLKDEPQLVIDDHNVKKPVDSCDSPAISHASTKKRRRRRRRGGDALDDVGMARKFLEDCDFADRRSGHSFVFVLETDLLDGDDLVVLRVARLVDDAVGALAELLEGFVLLQTRCG